MANKRRHISDINEILDYVTNDIDSDMDMDLGESDFEDDAESLEYESEVEDGHEVEEETNIEMTTDSQVGILMVDEPVENNNFIIVDEDNHVFEAENIDIPGGEVSSEAEEELKSGFITITRSTRTIITQVRPLLNTFWKMELICVALSEATGKTSQSSW